MIYKLQTVQYIILIPVRVNVVSLYAFCNIHDVSWGTCGEAVPLPSITVKKWADGLLTAEEIDPLARTYGEAAQILKTKEKTEISNSLWPAEETQFRQFRTLVAGTWALSNGFLVSTTLSLIRPEQDLIKSVRFVGLVLWTFVGLTAVKFVGALWYFLIQKRENSAKVKRVRKLKAT